MDSATLTDVIDGFEALCGTGGSAPDTRELVTMTGPEAGRYLQGQLSQDVVVLAVGASAWSLLLQPTGKVDAWLRVHRTGDEEYALDVDLGWGEAVIARLRRFLLRTKAEIGEVEVREVLSVRHEATLVQIGAEPPGGAEGRLAGVVAGPSVAGVDWILPAGDAAAEEATVPAAALERYRVAHAVPRMGAELTDATIPGEAGQWLVQASVDFAKGCYTGQELVARIDSRGNTVPRPVRLLRIDQPEAMPVPGAAILHDGAEVGRVTSAVPALGEGHPALVLAPVGRAVAVGTQVTVELDGSAVPATLVDPPMRP
ncbi:YgfZ/GcvT domain-containing protein [Rhabdothermincola salaria]|uniref:CAF17-like 4Fe-4S cluster assembly/insertion protein YgfZ n=1 Tax=Rhabdothermincola salaria TaxID=2903142 RepID=UPI001E3DD04E|nr:glycine cleavage T C-terminal barrel domain-containing protein [Rhabdothermincola salaria]MCD9622542.1 hypothetical protein [Rhabdothermincola salaria]